MSDDGWDADDFDPSKQAKPAAPTDKWEGEDEDDDVKDAWDKSDSEEDKSKDDVAPMAASQKKGKKRLADKIAEREAKLEAEAAEQPLTAEEKLAEKLRLQKLQEIQQKKELQQLCGRGTGVIDSMNPENKEQFDEFRKAISDKIQLYSTSEHYNDMVENLVKEISVDLNKETLKKIKMHVEGLHTAKTKEEKAAKPKQKAKGGKMSTVKMDLEKDIYGGSVGDYDDGMDDFM